MCTAGQNLSDGRSLQICTPNVLSQFLLAVEPGAYLLCNGWDARFGRPLGLPVGNATSSGASGSRVWRRAFASGVVATWFEQNRSGDVHWPPAPA
jgi:hypothetical protein